MPSIWQDIVTLSGAAYSTSRKIGKGLIPAAPPEFIHPRAPFPKPLRKKVIKWVKSRKLHVRIEWVIIAFLAGLILARSAHAAEPMPVTHKTFAELPTLPQTALTAEAPLQTHEEPKPVVAPVNSSYSGTGDQYLDWIISHESGGNAFAINPSSGACGLAQELPCGKSGCALGDAACQINWMRSYCIQRYGSTYGAYLYWIAHGNY